MAGVATRLAPRDFGAHATLAWLIPIASTASGWLCCVWGMASFSEMSKQALIPKNKIAIKEVLLGPAGLYEALVDAYMAGKSAGTGLTHPPL